MDRGARGSRIALGKARDRMRGWSRRAEAWLTGLGTWQFVLTWSTAVVVGTLVGAAMGEWLWAGHFNPSALLGFAVGSALASTLTAFAVRDRMREKAKQRANGTVTRARRWPSGRA
jgi:hypothetical protein